MKKYRIISEKKIEELIQERICNYVKDMNRDYEREILMKQANIATLQGQINPHFLYNSLECIRGQALIQGAAEIADTTQALSKFFRYSISSKSDVVTLKEELDNVINYMKIQQYRFKDRFNLAIKYDKDEERILNAQLPKLTLQPIVENAIEHGFEQKSSDAMIKIEIIDTKKNLNIIVSDNGRGMNVETLNSLLGEMENERSDKSSEKEGTHIGIAMNNVNRRIKLFYGEEYGLFITSIENIGTDVEIHIPL